MKKLLVFFLLVFSFFFLLSSYFFYKNFLVKRFFAGQVFDVSGQKFTSYGNLVPVLVIGSGPAGLSAALYSSRMNFFTVLLRGGVPGGQLLGSHFVENWPAVTPASGLETMKSFEDHVKTFGTVFLNASAVRVDFSTWPFSVDLDNGDKINALSVVIATGAVPRKLGVKGEDIYWGHGVGSCAVCDAAFYKSREVIVVGGGDSAVESAIILADAGAKKVYMAVRRDKMRASLIMQKRLKHYSNVEILFNTVVKEIKGGPLDAGECSGVVQVKGGLKVKVVDKIADERKGSIWVKSVDLFNKVSRKKYNMPINGVFLSIGHVPSSKIFKDYVDCDKFGYITLTSRGQETSKRGVFAAGDVADFEYRQAGVASGDGIKAGLDAVEFLRDIGFVDQVADSISKRLYSPTVRGRVSSIPLVETVKEFESKIQEKGKLVVLDFYTKNCGACVQVERVLSSLVSELDWVKFYKILVCSGSELSEKLVPKFSIKQVPTILVLKDGSVVSKTTQIKGADEFVSYLKEISLGGASVK